MSISITLLPLALVVYASYTGIVEMEKALQKTQATTNKQIKEAEVLTQGMIKEIPTVFTDVSLLEKTLQEHNVMVEKNLIMNWFVQ